MSICHKKDASSFGTQKIFTSFNSNICSIVFKLSVFFFLFSLKTADLTVRANAVLRGILGDRYDVLNITLHPQYNHETFDYDIALLQVSKLHWQ
jgi:hypothetical protein